MARHGAAGWGLAVLAALALTGCDDPAPRQQAPAGQGTAAPATPQGRPGAAMLAAEERLRARLRAEGPLTLRAVQAYRQALPDTLAICGQVHPSGRGDEPYLPWVAVVAFEGTTPIRTDVFLAASTPEATRVYFEMVDRCFDGGGPASPRQGIRPLPPAPSGLPRSAEDPTPRALAPPPVQVPPGLSVPGLALPVPAQAAPDMPPADATPADALPAPVAAAPVGPPQGLVTTTARHPVNLRAAPAGGSEVLRVLPRASTLQVFGEAPGGWLQVGEGGEPWGWLHSSLVDR